jgi:hypothetical protein
MCKRRESPKPSTARHVTKNEKKLPLLIWLESSANMIKKGCHSSSGFKTSANIGELVLSVTRNSISN